MRKILLTSLVMVLLAAMPVVAFAQGPYDLAEYFLMPTGSWAEFDESGDSVADFKQEFGSLIGLVLERGYDKVGPVWVAGDIDIWRVDATGLYHIGEWEADIPGLSLNHPSIHIPKSVSVGEVVAYATQEDELEPPYGREWVIGRMIITDYGITVTTPAGAFTDCLEIQSVEIDQEVEEGVWYLGAWQCYYKRNIGTVRCEGAEVVLGNPGSYEEWTEELVDYYLAP